MSRAARRAVGYWLRATLPRRSRGLVGLAVLVALLGGIAMASVAAARRTQSAHGAYLAQSNASDLEVFPYHVNFATRPGAAELRFQQALAASPLVRHVAASPTVVLVIHEPKGTPEPQAIEDGKVNFVGSVGGAYISQDRPVVVAGRMLDPSNRHEIVASRDAAAILHWHVGQRIALDAYTQAQLSSTTGFPPPGVHPPSFEVTLVGIVVFANEVAHDDVDRYPTFVLVSPAITPALRPYELGYPTYLVRLRAGAASVAAAEAKVAELLPAGSVYSFHVTSIVEGQVQRAIRPETIALAVFGLIAAAAGLLIGAQGVRRQVWARRGELAVLRALGASRPSLVAGAALGPVAAVVAGTALATALAIALSPIAPIGSVRLIDPSPGVAPDWTVLVTGTLVIFVSLSALAILFALGVLRGIVGARVDTVPRRSRLAEAAVRAGLPAPAVAGVRFSLERGAARSAAPARTALLAATLAVAIVVTTITFASSLLTLDSHPRLYGWNWSYAITSPTGESDPPVAGRLLSEDPLVAAWSGMSYANAQLHTLGSNDVQTVPILIVAHGQPVGPPLLQGHEVDGTHEIVLGSQTLAQLGAHVGQTIVASYGSKKDAPVYVPPTRVQIVGVATMPAIGSSGSLHTSMGIGAEIPASIEPPAFQAALRQPDPNENGPSIDVVRLRPGVSLAAGRASLEAIVRATNAVAAKDPNLSADFEVLGTQRPAEIVIYQTTGATPAVLAVGLAVGAIVALALALSASVRRRRRDLALLKTLGFTRGQLAMAISCQASVVAVVGIVFGVPIGIAVGRWLWVLFARTIAAVPAPTVPAAQVAVVALAAIALANLVAAVPGRVAARTPAALVLRSE